MRLRTASVVDKTVNGFKTFSAAAVIALRAGVLVAFTAAADSGVDDDNYVASQAPICL